MHEHVKLTVASKRTACILVQLLHGGDSESPEQNGAHLQEVLSRFPKTSGILQPTKA